MTQTIAQKIASEKGELKRLYLTIASSVLVMTEAEIKEFTFKDGSRLKITIPQDSVTPFMFEVIPLYYCVKVDNDTWETLEDEQDAFNAAQRLVGRVDKMSVVQIVKITEQSVIFNERGEA